MKKHLIAFLLIFSVFLATTGCSAANAASKLDAAEDNVEEKLDAAEDSVKRAVRRAVTPAPTSMETAADTTITQAQAENIALEYVGFTVDQVTRMRTEYEVDNGIPQYDVEFHKDDWEYEFEISAKDGQILSFDKDHKYD